MERRRNLEGFKAATEWFGEMKERMAMIRIGTEGDLDEGNLADGRLKDASEVGKQL